MKTIVFTSVLCLAASLAPAQNLLVNGDFNTPSTILSSSGGENYAATPTGWTTWTYSPNNDVWVNHQQDNTYSYDGSFYMGLGNFGGSGDACGFYQTVPGTAGTTYNLSVESGVQNWWWPEGEMRLFFLDASNDILGQQIENVTTSITGYDQGLPWTQYSVSATAPAGTAQVKVEFAVNYNTSSGGGGTVFFDDAVLTAVPEPSTCAVLALGGLALMGYRRLSRRS